MINNSSYQSFQLLQGLLGSLDQPVVAAQGRLQHLLQQLAHLKPQQHLLRLRQLQQVYHRHYRHLLSSVAPVLPQHIHQLVVGSSVDEVPIE